MADRTAAEAAAGTSPAAISVDAASAEVSAERACEAGGVASRRLPSLTCTTKSPRRKQIAPPFWTE